MEIKWIEDFLSLARTHNFSRSAEERNVTQPAFGRRIRALERWLGTDLVDRRTYPITLTVDGTQFRETASSVLAELYRNKATFAKSTVDFKPDIKIAAANNLVLTFLPGWYSGLATTMQPFTLRVRTENFHDMIDDLTSAEIDLVVQYYHREVPLLMDTNLVEWLTLGTERLRLYSTTDGSGNPAHNPHGDVPVPLFAYSNDGYFAQITSCILKNSETDMAPCNHVVESPTADFLLKFSATTSGILWLPENGAKQAVKDHTLIPVGDGVWDTEMEIRMFFRRNVANPLTSKTLDVLRQTTKSALKASLQEPSMK